MRHKNQRKLHLGSQAGVTLLLSVLLLTSITTITFSLAAVGFAELSTTDDLSNTEPIFYATLGVAEEATFMVKRKVDQVFPAQVNLGDCNTNTWAGFATADASVQSQVKACSVSPQNQVEFHIPLSHNDEGNATKLYLYDPSNAGAGDGGYNEIVLENTSELEKIFYKVCDFEDACPTEGSLAPNDPAQPLSIGLDTTKSYEVSLWRSVDFPTTGAFVQVTTQPIGLPYLNKKSVEIQSTAGRLTRRVQVLIPTQ